jgi:hypothetical protein
MCNNIEKYKELEFFLHKDTTYKERDYEQSPSTSPVVPRKDLPGQSPTLTCYEESPTTSPMLQRRESFKQTILRRLPNNMSETAHSHTLRSGSTKHSLMTNTDERETKRPKTNEMRSDAPLQDSDPSGNQLRKHLDNNNNLIKDTNIKKETHIHQDNNDDNNFFDLNAIDS